MIGAWPGWYRADLLVLQDTGIVLDDAVGHHDVTDRQCRVEPARHTGENNCATTESVGQQRGDDGGVDLAHPGSRQHHVVAVEHPGDESRVRSGLAVGLAQIAAQRVQFLRDGADESDGHSAL